MNTMPLPIRHEISTRLVDLSFVLRRHGVHWVLWCALSNAVVHAQSIGPVIPLSDLTPVTLASTHGVPPDPLDSSPLFSGERISTARPNTLLSAPNPWQVQELARLRMVAEDKTAKPETSANAAWTLGLLSLHGIAMPINLAQAEKWFFSASEKGLHLAHAGLAWCAMEACAGPPKPDAFQKSIVQLKRTHVPRALFLQWLALSRLTPLQLPPAREHQTDSPSRPDEYMVSFPNAALLKEAVDHGDVQAQIEWGIYNANHGRLTQALSYFEAAAARSSVAKMNAQILAERIAGSKDLAKPSVQRTTANISSEGFWQAARRHHKGEGVPANFSEAIRLYRISASMGNVLAEKMLRLIYSNLSPDGQINVVWMQQLRDVDLSTPVPQHESVQPPFRLGREATPLYDLLPTMWR